MSNVYLRNLSIDILKIKDNHLQINLFGQDTTVFVFKPKCHLMYEDVAQILDEYTVENFNKKIASPEFTVLESPLKNVTPAVWEDTGWDVWDDAHFNKQLKIFADKFFPDTSINLLKVRGLVGEDEVILVLGYPGNDGELLT